MPTIQIRNVPEHIYKALADQARFQRRTVPQQAIVVLARGLDVDVDHRARRREVLRKIREIDHTPYQDLPDPVRLIREDRDR